MALIKPVLEVLRLRYRLTTLAAVPAGSVWKVVATLNPTGERPTAKEIPTTGVDMSQPPAPELARLGLGSAAIERVFKKTRVEQAKGQILEELALVTAGKSQSTVGSGEGSHGDSPLPQIIAPHRVKAGGSLGDGLRAILGTDATGPFIRILEIIESKAGGARRELARVRDPWEKASTGDKAEARADVVDALIRKHDPEVDPSGDSTAAYRAAKRAVLQTYSKEALEYMAKRKFEGSEFLGQPAQDLERLSPNIGAGGAEVPARITVDDVERRVAGFSRKGIRITGVVPGGGSTGRTEQDVRDQGVNFVLKQADVTEKKLGELARQVVAISGASKK